MNVVVQKKSVGNMKNNGELLRLICAKREAL